MTLEEFWELKDNKEECNYLYGGTDFSINDEDIAALKSGKIINFSVNFEYGCTLSYGEKSGEVR